MKIVQYRKPSLDFAEESIVDSAGTSSWASSVDMTDAERDARTAQEWLDAVAGYLEFRAGCRWRRLHRAGQRSNPVRWYYLGGLRLLEAIRYAPDAKPQPVFEMSRPPRRHLPTLEQIAKRGVAR